MERLVYSPRVDVFVKTQDDQVVDLSPYVVNCTVNRKVGQVSTASVAFRNPNRMFTDGLVVDADGTKHYEPVFKPMDPIIIVMTRLRNYPIQVFTGYCDKTPYLSLYPGVVTLDASCTLKRLLYTFFDAGLPFVWEVLQQNGWMVSPAQGMLMNPAADAGAGSDNGKNLTDANFGKLLETVLVEIGNWKKENIFIEDLPEGIDKQVSKLYEDIRDSSEKSQKEFQDLLKQIIGTSSTGASDSTDSGGSSTGTIESVPGVPSKYLGMYEGAADRFNLGKDGWAYLASVHSQETGFSTNVNTSSAGAQGPMQFMPGTWAGYGVDADGDGKKDIMNDKDAIYGAANYLRASGAPGDWKKALFAYNHADWYVQEVYDRAQKFIRTAKHKQQDLSTEGGVLIVSNFPASGTSWDLSGTATTFGDSKKYHFDDPDDDSYGSQKPSSGLDPDVPGFACRASSRSGGWYVLRAPNGKAAAIRQTDTGPGVTSVTFDINTPAAHLFGYEHGNAFKGNTGTWRAKYFGKGEAAKKKAEEFIK